MSEKFNIKKLNYKAFRYSQVSIALLYFSYGFLYGFLAWYIPFKLVFMLGPIIAAIFLVLMHFIDIFLSTIANQVKKFKTRKILTSVGIILYLISYILTILSVTYSNIILILIACICVGLSAIGSIPLSLILFENLPEEYSYEISSICSILLVVGWGVSSSLIAYLFILDKIYVIILISSICTLSLALSLTLRGVYRENDNSKISIFSAFREYIKSGFEILKINNRIAIMLLLSSLAWGITYEYLSPYLFEAKHLTILNIGLLFTAMILVGGVVDLVIDSIIGMNSEYFRNIVILSSFIGFLSWIAVIFVPPYLEIIPITISYSCLRISILKGCYIYLLSTSDYDKKIAMSDIYHAYTDFLNIIAVGIGGVLYSIFRSLPIICTSTLQLLTLATVI